MWSGSNIAFWIITLFVLGSGALAAFSRNIVRSAYSLFFTLFGVAGYYVLLGSGFLAVTQVIIYVGGILVLIMFGILLTERPMTGADHSLSKWQTAGVFATMALMLLLLSTVFLNAGWPLKTELVEPAENIRSIGSRLLSDYLLVLELSGMTLLLCLFGAAYLVRRREQ